MNTNSQTSMEGKVALVTGAASGIGLAATRLLAKRGASLFLLGRTRDELEEAFDELGGGEAGHHMLLADVSSEKEMMAAFDSLGKFHAALDVVVANAGVNGLWAPLDQFEVDEWDQTLAINLRGTFLTVKLALPYLKIRGGSVVIISSVNGTRMFSNSGATAYACSKAAQVAFARMTALELAKDRIRVNSVCPGAIDTRIDDSTERVDLDGLHLPVDFPKGEIPLTAGRSGTAHDVAEAILFLASDASRHVSGTEIYVDGAQSLLQG